MKIKLSKSQWETIGKQTGWAKTAQNNPSYDAAMAEFKKVEESGSALAQRITGINCNDLGGVTLLELAGCFEKIIAEENRLAAIKTEEAENAVDSLSYVLKRIARQIAYRVRDYT